MRCTLEHSPTHTHTLTYANERRTSTKTKTMKSMSAPNCLMGCAAYVFIYFGFFYTSYVRKFGNRFFFSFAAPTSSTCICASTLMFHKVFCSNCLLFSFVFHILFDPLAFALLILLCFFFFVPSCVFACWLTCECTVNIYIYTCVFHLHCKAEMKCRANRALWSIPVKFTWNAVFGASRSSDSNSLGVHWCVSH